MPHTCTRAYAWHSCKHAGKLHERDACARQPLCVSATDATPFYPLLGYSRKHRDERSENGVWKFGRWIVGFTKIERIKVRATWKALCFLRGTCCVVFDRKECQGVCNSFKASWGLRELLDYGVGCNFTFVIRLQRLITHVIKLLKKEAEGIAFGYTSFCEILWIDMR